MAPKSNCIKLQICQMKSCILILAIALFIHTSYSSDIDGDNGISSALAEALISEDKHIVVVSKIRPMLFLDWVSSDSPLVEAAKEVRKRIETSYQFRELYMEDNIGMKDLPDLLPLFMPSPLTDHELSLSASGEAWILVVERISEDHEGIWLLDEELDNNEWLFGNTWIICSYATEKGAKPIAIPIDWQTEDDKNRLQLMYPMLHVPVDQFMHELDRLYAVANIFSESKRNSEDEYVEFYASLFQSDLSRSILKHLIDQKY